MSKPILCLDFDGVLHSYTSGWKGAACIPDPPVPGAMAFLVEAVERFQVAVFSSRSSQQFGVQAMWDWLRDRLAEHLNCRMAAADLVKRIDFPLSKPAAFVTLDDRAINFAGTFPPIESLKAFRPWTDPRAVQWPSDRPRPGIWSCADDGKGSWGWVWLGDTLDDAVRRAAAPKPEKLF